MRKVLNRSLQGVDELGGYVLAVGTGLSFAAALLARAHIRIDVIHERLPRALRVAFNIAAAPALSSACFQKSNQRLGCISCHDPHSAPSEASR